MITRNISSICKEVLLKKRYSLHWYIDTLLGSMDALLDLTLDDGLSVVNSKLLPIDDNGIMAIPDGASDIVEVSIIVGQKKRILIEDNKINELSNYDSSLNVARYDTSQLSSIQTANLYSWGCNTVNIDNYGSNLGRRFGGTVNYSDTYKVLFGRNEIQLNEQSFATNAIVSFVGDGRSSDAATHIDVAAEGAIKAAINWQLAENSRTYSTGDKERLRQLYLGQRQILRARKADWSIEKLKRIVNKNTRYFK